MKVISFREYQTQEKDFSTCATFEPCFFFFFFKNLCWKDHVYKDDGLLYWWRRLRPGVGGPGHEFVEQLWGNIKK